MSIIPVALGSKSGLFPLLGPGSLPADTACLALGICRQQRAWSYRAHTDTLTVPGWDTHRINTGMDLSEDWLLSLAWGKKINACVVPLGTRKNYSRGTELPAMIPPSTILLSTFCDSKFGTPSFILPVLLVLGPCYQQGLKQRTGEPRWEQTQLQGHWGHTGFIPLCSHDRRSYRPVPGISFWLFQMYNNHSEGSEHPKQRLCSIHKFLAVLSGTAGLLVHRRAR